MSEHDVAAQGTPSGDKSTVDEYQADCVRCPRLASFLGEVHARYPSYACRPVPPFGDRRAPLLIVGLAPGMHGANRSGRPFTGDYAGILLYETLRDFGFANQAGSPDAHDGLVLSGCRITNAVKCLPPDNKPLPVEIRTCNGFLAAEIDLLRPRVVLALGLVAHRAILMARGLRQGTFDFGHGARHQLPDGIVLIDSYHCSRYNTQTRRLTPAMFHAVFEQIRSALDGQ